MAKTARLPSEERRKQIVRAGLELCRTAGISALRTEKIAHKIGLSPGALFRHFSSKSEILQGMADELIERLESTVPEEEDPWRWIEQFVIRRARLLRDDPEVRLLFSDGFIMALPEETQEDVHQEFSRTWRRLTEQIKRAQDAGHIRADLQTHELAAAVAGLVQSVLHPPIGNVPEWSEPEAVWKTVQDLLSERAGATTNP